MHNILLVDDEPWILESLRGTVDWGAHGFSVAGTASNGLEAWERIQELKPDLVFVDVRMPGMNGLQLIKRIYESESAAQCIVASGYDEFEYAKQAMQYGAIGYCLKPFSEPEIVELLGKVKAGIQRSRIMIEYELLSCIQEQGTGQAEPEAKLTQLLERASFGWKPGMDLGVVVVQGTDSNDGPLVTAGIRSLALCIGSGKTAYILPGDEMAAVETQAAKPLPNGVRGIGFSPTDNRVGCLRKLIDAAHRASYQYFLTGEAVGTVSLPAQSDELEKETWRLLEEGIRNKDRVHLSQIFTRLEAQFESGRYGIRHAFRFYNRVLDYLHGGSTAERPESVEHVLFDYEELVRTYGSLHRMFEDLLAIAADSFVPAIGEGEEMRGKEVFKQILHYVNTHFREPISVNEMAKKFYLHPNYLSLLFKKELQINFTKYLADIRMDYACELLRGTAVSVSEIAERTGYSDYFYFAKLFKKHLGMTPTEYRGYGNGSTET